MNAGTQLVGVHPRAALDSHNRLWQGLSLLYPVSFVPLENEDSLDAIVSLDGVAPVSDRLEGNIRCFAAPSAERDAVGLGVQISANEELDRRLRGRTLEPEEQISLRPIATQPDDLVLATSGQDAVWVRRQIASAGVDIVAFPISVLTEDEVIRDGLRPGRCMALLPLIHFLRELTRESDWQPPPLRATLMIDDPNLHAMSYGFIGFPSLVEHAERHNYHLSSATIPIDGWYVNGRTASYFSEHADRISLLVHGNNHSRHELAQDRSESDLLALAAQALRRIERLEARSGLRVARVMAAPHGKLSAPMASALARTGYDAVCHSRPFPWIKRLPPDVPLSGMTPAQWTKEGLPILPRFSMAATETDIVLRAFLNQPLILLGHHWDAVDDYALFERAASIVNSLGDVQWMDMERMAHSNYEWRREGSVLHVQAYSKQLEIAIPEGVESVAVEVPAIGDAEPGVIGYGGSESPSVRENGALHGPVVGVTGSRCNVRWRHARPVGPGDVTLPSTPLQHVFRRVATELRDRCRPLTGK